MDEKTTLGSYLRAERERRELSLKTISENTKVSLPLLEGLESDDISRWPGGIFRRAFVRSYAEAVGLDPDDVYRRFGQQYTPPASDLPGQAPRFGTAELQALEQAHSGRGGASWSFAAPSRARFFGTAADLTVAAILGFGSAAAGSRLLWPVLLIAAYYAAGVLLTGTSPMVALLGHNLESDTAEIPAIDRTFAPAVEHVELDGVNVDPILDHSPARPIS